MKKVQLGLQDSEGAKLLAGFVWNTGDVKRCRYDYEEGRLYFDRIPAGSTKAEVTLRFITIDEGQDSLEFVDVVFEVLLPCCEVFIPESGGYGDVGKGLLKFALIRFFDGSGLLFAGKTAVVVG